MIAKNEIAGAVTLVVSKDRILHLETTGFADVAAKRPMTAGLGVLDRLDDQADHRHRGAHAAGRREAQRSAIPSRSTCPSLPA